MKWIKYREHVLIADEGREASVRLLEGELTRVIGSVREGENAVAMKLKNKFKKKPKSEVELWQILLSKDKL